MKKTEKDVDVTLGPFAGDFVSPNGKVDRVKMAVGQILYIPVCSFVDCNLQLFTTFTGFEVPCSSKGGIGLAKTRRRTPPSQCC